MKPFYFIVSFWGKEFREHFLRLSAASLLAPGNVPSLSNRDDSRLFICTTQNDWSAIQGDPIFCQLISFIEPIFVELKRPAPPFLKPILYEKHRRDASVLSLENGEPQDFWVTPDDVFPQEKYKELESLGREIGKELTVSHHYALRILFMSLGHKIGAERAFQEKANAVFLGADLVTSDGTVKELERLVREGHKVVLTATLRFAQDECLTTFKEAGHMVPEKPLVLPPRLLVKTVFQHMHPETACFEFDSPYFCDTATSSLWKVPGDDGILLHNLNFYPLLVNYEGVDTHQADYFDTGGTIDGKYIAMHFDPHTDITIVTDSDRLMLASFTPRGEYYYPLTKGWRKNHPWFKERYKTHLIRKTLHGPMGDPVKRHCYSVPIKFHSQSLTTAWSDVERRAAVVANLAATKGSVWDAILGLSFSRTTVKTLLSPINLVTLATRLMKKLPEHQQHRLKTFVRRRGWLSSERAS